MDLHNNRQLGFNAIVDLCLCICLHMYNNVLNINKSVDKRHIFACVIEKSALQSVRAALDEQSICYES